MTFAPPETFNIADYFLEARLREGKGDRVAIRTDTRDLAYREVNALANRFGHVLRDAGVRPEQRVMIALPDGPEYVGALFGALKIGAVVVMVNPELKPDAVAQLFEYTRAVAAIVDAEAGAAFRAAAGSDDAWDDGGSSGGSAAARTSRPARGGDGAGRGGPPRVLTLGLGEVERALDAAPNRLDVFPSRRDDAAIWLFSGGTTGRPKAVVQTHASFANTTECYAKGALGYSADDVTLSVPKLFFGYATGSNLLFPFAVGASAVLFPERCTAEVLFDKIRRFRPTILVNVPAMVARMVNHPDAARQDLTSLRLSTSAGEALPVELHRRWVETFGVDLLDGLGTAEMWHIFLTNLPGRARPGTLGTVVPGFDVRVRDEEGRDLPDGDVGLLWVRGGSRAIGYWQLPESTQRVFRGEWVVTGDLVRRDADGTFTHCGRADDMLKVSGKWLSPQEVESCLLQHPAVRECAVVGVADERGLVKPHAFVVAGDGEGVDAAAARVDLAETLKEFVRERLDAYKHPRAIVFVDVLPRTHLGKVDRARLKRGGAPP
ncbi:MAG TPA: benzoate-CoA ligase family protein [Gemmatimonadota bacterium]|jgi:benzoate-CoA ligase family protein